ncbi:MAG: kelch repeat-containing protein [Myxococcota bacterium]|nr:kelch repeat-containing protein [Myxococcota bacterium]
MHGFQCLQLRKGIGFGTSLLAMVCMACGGGSSNPLLPSDIGLETASSQDLENSDLSPDANPLDTSNQETLADATGDLTTDVSRDLTADMTADRVEEAYEDVVIDLCDPNTCDMDEHRVCEAETGKCVCDEDFCEIEGTCVANGSVPSDFSCYVCDSERNKTGWSLQLVGTLCRPSAGPCDVAEFCDGATGSCPTDLKSTALCRAASGDCDIAEYCDGSSNDCPKDAYHPVTWPCGNAESACITDQCDGYGNCTLLGLAPAFTVCDDGNPLTLNDRCDGAGNCVPHLCNPEQVGTWIDLPSLNLSRGFTCAVHYSGKVYVFGGAHQDGVQFPPPVNSVEAFDIGTRTWSYVASMPTATYGSTCGEIGGLIYLVGGRVPKVNSSENGDVVQVYNPSSDTWSRGPSLRTLRSWLGGAVLGGKFYALCGVGNTYLSSVERLTPGGSWVNLGGQLAAARYMLGVGVYDGKIYAIGGDNWIGDSQKLFDYIEVFDPNLGYWSTVGHLPVPATSIMTAFFPDGPLYLLYKGKLWTMDPTTYAVTEIGALPATVGTAHDSGIAMTREGILAAGGGSGRGPHRTDVKFYCK